MKSVPIPASHPDWDTLAKDVRSVARQGRGVVVDPWSGAIFHCRKAIYAAMKRRKLKVRTEFNEENQTITVWDRRIK